MRITNKQLINLPAYTEDGDPVGHVVGFEMDIDNHLIVAYYIGSRKLVNELLNTLGSDNTLHIVPEQVVSITEEQMIVKSTAISSQEDSEISLTQPEVNTAVSASVHQLSD